MAEAGSRPAPTRTAVTMSKNIDLTGKVSLRSCMVIAWVALLTYLCRVLASWCVSLPHTTIFSLCSPNFSLSPHATAPVLHLQFNVLDSADAVWAEILRSKLGFSCTPFIPLQDFLTQAITDYG